MAILPYRESKIHLISLVLVQLRVHVNHFSGIGKTVV